MKLSNVFLKPVITEKGLEAARRLNEYTFLVSSSWDKKRIKKAVEKIFEVKVKSVRTAVARGKTKRVGKRLARVKKPDFKKAILKLAEKEKIALFETKEKKK